jgi:Bacterial protein of unknown function (DUF899)
VTCSMDWISRNNDQEHSMKGDKKMPTHKTGTREQWLAERLELLKAEKELTRRSDELAVSAGTAVGSDR